MLHEGLFDTLYDVQCFDLAAVASYRVDADHRSMSASLYANPDRRDAIAHRLDAMILGAAEVDLDFNVNVTAVGGGRIIGGSGGHSDTAAGAKLTIITTRLRAKGNPKIVTCVECVTTPGASVDVVVTEAGVAVNPQRHDLLVKLRAAGLPIIPIAIMREIAEKETGRGTLPTTSDGRVVAVVQYRDGSVIDVVLSRNPDS